MGENLRRLRAAVMCALLAVLALSAGRVSAQWYMDFDEDFAAASASRTVANWWDGLGLSAAWTLAEGSGTNTLDRIGAVNGNLNGQTWTNDVTAGTSLWFPGGANQRVDMGDKLDAGTNGIVLAAWIWANAIPDTSNPDVLVSKANSSATLRYTVGLNSTAPSGRLYILLSDGTGTINANANTRPITPSNWVHVAGFVARSGYAATFTNGLFEASVSTTARTNSINITEALMIGNDPFDIVNRPFNGIIRDVAIKFNGTTNDITAIYNATKARYGR